MPEPDTISADYTLRPSELAEILPVLVDARQPTLVWGPAGCGKSQIARQTADALGMTLHRHPRAAPRSRRPARHPLARRQRDPLGAAGVSAAQHRGRPVPRQPGGTRQRRADGPGRALPALPGTQDRRVRAPRGRRPHRLLEPRERSRRRPPDAGTARQPLRPPRAPPRSGRLARLGRRQRHRARGPVFHPGAPRAPLPVRSAVEGEGVPEPPQLGIRVQHPPAAHPRHHIHHQRPRDGALALPPAPWAKPRPWTSAPS